MCAGKLTTVWTITRICERSQDGCERAVVECDNMCLVVVGRK